MELLRSGLVFTLIIMKDYGKAELQKVHRFRWAPLGVVGAFAILVFSFSAVGICG